MKEWFSLAELSAMRLNAIAGDHSNVWRQAQREGWQFRAADGRGGGREYHISSLPEAARIDLALRSLQSDTGLPAGVSPHGSSSIPATACPAVSIPQTVDFTGHAPSSGSSPGPNAARAPHALQAAPEGKEVAIPRTRATTGAATIPTGKAARRAAARLVIINLLSTFKIEGGLSMVAARSAFSSLFNGGAIHVEGWVKEEVGKLSVGSLQRWQAQVAREGARSLGGKYGNRKGKGQIDGDAILRDFCIANMAARPHLIATQLQQAIYARFGREIPKRTVQRFMANAREQYADAFLQARNPDEYKNLRLVAFGSRSEGVAALNSLWETDASPADMELLDPTTESGKRRYHLLAVVDVFSRRAKVLVTPVSKAVAVTLTIRRAIMDWGVPDTIKMDNGQDFASAHVARALGALQIEQRFCPPFTPEAKPHVERFFQTLQHELVSMLPGFVGHNVAQRKGIEAARAFSQRLGEADKLISAEVTADELQERIDSWLENIYHRRRHGSLGTSPMLQAVNWLGEVRMIDDERALDMLLAEAPDTEGIRTVGKKGLRVENTHFIAPELGAYVGERVHVRLDPADMGRIIVYTLDMKFICVAVAPEREGIDRREIGIAAKKIQRDRDNEARADMKRRTREHKPHRMMDEILDAARRDAEAEKVVAFNRPTITHSTPALDAAADAVRVLDDPMPAMPEISMDDAARAEEAREALVLQMPAREAATPAVDPRLVDDWAWFKWAREHDDELNDIQRETYHALESDPLIQLRLEEERRAQA